MAKHLFDSHAHVSFEAYDEDRSIIITHAKEAGLSGWMEVGTDVPQSRKAIKLAEKVEGVYASVGVHPVEAPMMLEEDWDSIEQMVSHPSVKAVGEVGLDIYRANKEDFKKQKIALHRFIELAEMQKLPMIFHVRDNDEISAHDALIELLSEYPEGKRPRGVIHTYSGNEEQARKYLDLGMILSFSGVVTFKNAEVTAEVVKQTPLDKILTETDAPFLTPEPYRGKRNEPAHVQYVAEKIAELKDISREEVIEQIWDNTQKFFNFK